MSLKISMNGELVPKEEARISVFDHGLLYGDGIFEGIRVYDGKVFLLKDHIDRLYEGCGVIHIELPISKEQICDDVRKTVAANGIEDGYIRLIVTRGSGDLGLDYRKASNPQIIIIADTISLYPDELYEKGIPLVTASTIRNHPQAVNPRLKSLNYLNNVLAKAEGILAGTIEALMMNHKGEVAECTGDNIFIVKNDVVKTPPVDACILEGITRKTVMRLAEEAGYTVKECTMQRHDIYTADECFLTGTAAEVIPAISLDGCKIGDGKPGPVTNDLRDRFQQFTRSFE